jgi:hypothetical protein
MKLTLPSGKEVKLINPILVILCGVLCGIAGGLLAAACEVLLK